jgi:hypothetical protein
MRRPHASKKHDYDSSEEDSEIIEMEDWDERRHSGEGRPRRWRGDIESGIARRDDDHSENSGRIWTSDEDYRRGREYMDHDNNWSLHADHQKRIGRRQWSHVHENTYHGGMNVTHYHSAMGYRGPYYHPTQDHGHNTRNYPENMEMGYWNRGFQHEEANRYREPGPLYMDRGLPPPNPPHHPDFRRPLAWSTQMHHAPQSPQIQQGNQLSQDNEEEIKPRKVWWYTTCRVFSAILIILNIVSDWLQYSDISNISDTIHDVEELFKTKVKVCFHNEELGEQYMYFTIAGTVMAVLQLVNIIYQIVQNHRLKPQDQIPSYLDERTEVFLLNAFVRIPQNFILHRLEKDCVQCGISWDAKTIKRFLNGLSALLSSVWRFLTNLKVSASDTKCTISCSEICAKCGKCFGDCLKDCLTECFRDCIKCLCPCCCCCIE